MSGWPDEWKFGSDEEDAETSTLARRGHDVLRAEVGSVQKKKKTTGDHSEQGPPTYFFTTLRRVARTILPRDRFHHRYAERGVVIYITLWSRGNLFTWSLNAQGHIHEVFDSLFVFLILPSITTKTFDVVIWLVKYTRSTYKFIIHRSLSTMSVASRVFARRNQISFPFSRLIQNSNECIRFCAFKHYVR